MDKGFSLSPAFRAVAAVFVAAFVNGVLNPADALSTEKLLYMTLGAVAGLAAYAGWASWSTSPNDRS